MSVIGRTSPIGPRGPRRRASPAGSGACRTVRIAWIFVAPTIFLLLAINIFPLIWTIYLSFTNYRANRPNRRCGLDRAQQL